MPTEAVLKVTILGCGGSAGVPRLGGGAGPGDGFGDWGVCDPAEPRNRRLRSAILVEGPEGGRLLVDAGPDLREQLLTAGIGRLDAVVFTHQHADHIMGVDEMRPLNRSIGGVIPAYGTEETLEDVGRRFDYAFLPPTPTFYRPALVALPVPLAGEFTAAGLALRTFEQDHKVMRTLGLRIGGFAYSTDVVELPEKSLATLEGIDTWVVGCFQRDPHPVHANIGRVLEWVERLRPRRTVLTHMGPDMDYAMLREMLPPGIEPAYDGMRLEVPS
ncbi:MBL fold metallo-hydrolase [Roseomonas sp. NAR14]|uniref:MBL fold metallo-hydrolase n=1 Tax=Roseomonas acroporae TaxID=2937791 RepID=A0A9X2BV79_9PROT|nr:MBL fold metallo-hydrolase [Roseomonas acroporae]MCK8783734.1 MBL fold metallo-hydrolase [Roseomonas acroporae]